MNEETIEETVSHKSDVNKSLTNLRAHWLNMCRLISLSQSSPAIQNTQSVVVMRLQTHLSRATSQFWSPLKRAAWWCSGNCSTVSYSSKGIEGGRLACQAAIHHREKLICKLKIRNFKSPLATTSGSRMFLEVLGKKEETGGFCCGLLGGYSVLSGLSFQVFESYSCSQEPSR